MKLGLGFQSGVIEQESKFYIKEDTYFINTYVFIKLYKNDYLLLSKELETLIEKISLSFEKIEKEEVGQVSYVTTSALLNTELMIDPLGVSALTHDEIDILKYIITETYRLTSALNKVDWIYENFPLPDFSENKLYLRYGNVELRVIESFIRERIKLSDIEDIIQNQRDAVYVNKEKLEDNCRWLTAVDTRFNLKALMHTAGFYYPDSSESAAEVGMKDLNLWISKYLTGLASASLFSYPGCYPFFFNVWKYLKDQASFNGEHLNFPNPGKFFEMLKGKRVLIVTPFKTLFDRMVSEYRLKNLYHDFVIDDINIITIEAPVSTYPNKPDTSWGASYKKLGSQVDQVFSNEKIDIFMASCGCYGLPLTTDVFNKYSCCSVYYGNYLNTLFGIRQKASKDFMAGKLDESQRLDSDLSSRFEGMNKVDGGRYVS